MATEVQNSTHFSDQRRQFSERHFASAAHRDRPMRQIGFSSNESLYSISRTSGIRDAASLRSLVNLGRSSRARSASGRNVRRVSQKSQESQAPRLRPRLCRLRCLFAGVYARQAAPRGGGARQRSLASRLTVSLQLVPPSWHDTSANEAVPQLRAEASLDQT